MSESTVTGTAAAGSPGTPAGAPDLATTMAQWDRGAWQLAALAIATRDGADPDLAAAAGDVLAAAGLPVPPADGDGGPGPSRAQLSGQAAAPLLIAAGVVGRGGADWAGQSDDVLTSQGEASGQAARLFAAFGIARMSGLTERLAAPGARMLDVGTGVGALAVGYAETFPALHVVGIDVSERVLDLARRRVAASPVADRVAVRHADVAAFTDDGDGFDLAWLPAPFLPPAVLRDGLARVVDALRPGGWLMVGHAKVAADPGAGALDRFRTLAYGGTYLDEDAALGLLTAAGLEPVWGAPTPPGAPGITLGQRPAG